MTFDRTGGLTFVWFGCIGLRDGFNNCWLVDLQLSLIHLRVPIFVRAINSGQLFEIKSLILKTPKGPRPLLAVCQSKL